MDDKYFSGSYMLVVFASALQNVKGLFCLPEDNIIHRSELIKKRKIPVRRRKTLPGKRPLEYSNAGITYNLALQGTRRVMVNKAISCMKILPAIMRCTLNLIYSQFMLESGNRICYNLYQLEQR